MTCPFLRYRDAAGDRSFDVARAYCSAAERFVQPIRADVCNDRYGLDHATDCEIFLAHADEAEATTGDETGPATNDEAETTAGEEPKATTGDEAEAATGEEEEAETTTGGEAGGRDADDGGEA